MRRRTDLALGALAMAIGAGSSFALAGGCGEQAVGGDYLGQALFSIEGTVALSTPDTGTASGELRAALFWARPGGLASGGPLFDSVTAVEQDVGAASTFPARYALTIHRPPPAALIAETSDVQGRYAVAMILVYLDVDHSKTWDRTTEPLVGAARDSLVVYAPDGLTGGRFGALDVGFHLLRPSTAGATVSCDQALTPGDPSAVPLVVDMRFPGKALGDFDCDGDGNEWAGTCPSITDIWEACREGSPYDEDGLCATCEGLLWDEGASSDACAAWTAACEQLTADSHECEEAREHCQGDVECHDADDCPAPPPG